jgi:hypothetical protein
MRQDVNTLRLIRAGLAPRTGIGPAGALASADSSDERDQDRYLMTTPAPRSRKVVCSLSWFSTSRGSTRSNIQVSHQFTQQSSSFDPDRHLLIARVAGRQPVAPRSLPSVTSAAALKSPCARGISPRSLSAVSSLEVFLHRTGRYRRSRRGTQTTAARFVGERFLNRRRLVCIPSFWPLPAQVF